jgi:hypothetical protein
MLNFLLQMKKSPQRAPLDITNKVVQGVNTVDIREVIPPAGANPDPLPPECGFSIVKAYKLEKDATLKLLEQDPLYCRRADETLKMIKDQFIASRDIDVTDVKVPLTCPVRPVTRAHSDTRFFAVDQKTTGTSLFRCPVQAFVFFRRQVVCGNEPEQR